MPLFLIVIAFCGSVFAYAGSTTADFDPHPFYIGVNGGYGSTTWKGLVPSQEKKSIVLNMSTPTDVREGGGVWGGVVGFDFSPWFGMDVNYLSYPKAEVFFDETSLFSFENNGRALLATHTQTVSLMAKFMVVIPETIMRLYSSVGVGWIHRGDEINDSWLVAPSFGAGLNYPISEHWMGEIAANYISGYGESEISPANDFIPFVYAVFFRVAYRV